MNKKYILFSFFLLLALLSLLRPSRPASALPRFETIGSPSQLINAVNALRAANGLSALAVHPILMQTAQTQADYMASIGTWTHDRPGGITYTQQLLALGFPLAGDLSLGGFRAENVMMLSNPLVWNGVPVGWQDAAHMNTMLSQNFTHIGAGISQGATGYYYAVDTAAATGSGQMQDSASGILTSVPNGAAQSASQYMVPVTINTALPNGDVRHKVQYGQSLWSIAIEYGTTIKNIQALNNLGDDSVIYQGQDLLIQKAATQPAQPTSTAAALVLSTPTIAPTPSISLPTATVPSATIAPVELPASTSSSPSKLLVGILIVAALVGAGVAVWLIRDPN
ncbi:MAG: LysM peptidoglycan-binding domain-containing protein [Chloroflexi bacterium]|nr:LysM peptidoglycan-binding domain-containing protein [Chloroflexota bacterium]